MDVVQVEHRDPKPQHIPGKNKHSTFSSLSGEKYYA
jgi:hypothetical protein